MAPNTDDTPPSKLSNGEFLIHEESNSSMSSKDSGFAKGGRDTDSFVTTRNSNSVVLPLKTSKMANQQHSPSKAHSEQVKLSSKSSHANPGLNDQYIHVDSLLSLFSKQSLEGRMPRNKAGCVDVLANTNIQPGTTLDLAGIKAQSPVADEELARIKAELQQAKDKIAQMDQELSQQRVTQQTLSHVLDSPTNSKHNLQNGSTSNSHGAIDAAGNPEGYEIASSRASSAEIGLAGHPFGHFSNLEPVSVHPHSVTNTRALKQASNDPFTWNPYPKPAWPALPARFEQQQHARFPEALNLQGPGNFRMNAYPFENTHAGLGSAAGGLPLPPYEQGPLHQTFHTHRPNSVVHPFAAWGSQPASMSSSSGFSPPGTPMPFPGMGHTGQMSMPSHYHTHLLGTPLSATAREFNNGAMGHGHLYPPNPWNQQVSAENSSSYVQAVEPMNYRRLLDRNIRCDWKYIVDKIVCNNDQQASIFLQQKLKVATPEHKHELIESIISQAYPLMINRFGNFLVQRCFEHGTSDQVIAIANVIRGNTLSLSMDAFGCHVVQKAFDIVPEEYKAIMVHELLRRIPETVIHRYACHVWQKLFELRWNGSPPQIMKYVNEALRGMWHEVALGETGSLVVQNIFENCLEEDKRPCINEVLASIDVISHGQFGNWCIQHICEHGSPADKSRAVEHVLRFATEYSTDQFASKVVEKCLKVGGTEFLDRYLEKTCEGRPDRPRMPLVDIAGDQYGNYLVQWILINAGPHHRDIVSNHVKKHMVSLRGSKFGSRVAMLCSNPAVQTRPGPPVGVPINHANNLNSRFMPVPTAGNRTTLSYR